MYAEDSDGDGIINEIEGWEDPDGDGLANAYDTDSDGDGLGDAFEGSGDADSDGISNYLDLDSDADGLPDLLEGGFDNFSHTSVSDELLESVATALPESKNVDASFLNDAYKTDLTLSKEASVTVTFLDEGAGYASTLGYYVFPAGLFDQLTKGDVDTDGSGNVSIKELQAIDGVEIGWIFPNASKAGAGGALIAGDTVGLANGRQFPAGSTIGFFVVQNAWNYGSIKSPNEDGTKPLVFYTTDHLNPEAASTAGSETDTSVNLSRHVALLFADEGKENIIMGFEDLHRRDASANDFGYGSDEDFNDAVFTVASTPADAFQAAGIPTVAGDIPDADGDGIADADEFAGDSDGDGIDNVNDPDDDGDGIVTPTEGLQDADADGVANYLDTDSDGDGIEDSVEGSLDADADGFSNFLDLDSDNDGLGDSEEADLDTDGDGIANRVDSDDDGDGIPTAVEGIMDTDEDGVPNFLDTDSDNDGTPDSAEAEGDSDGDGILDVFDSDDDNDGIPTITEGYADSDGDGVADHIDLDSDNDDVPDADEQSEDADGDGFVNRVDADDDGDGIATISEGTADTDGDGVADFLDLDSDGDGLTDDIDYVYLEATTLALQHNYTGVPLAAEDLVTYVFTIKNLGMETATGVLIEGLVPEHTHFVAGSLFVDGVLSDVVLVSGEAVALDFIAGGSEVTIEFSVEVIAELPAEARWVESAVSLSCLESAHVFVSDNDANGHCGIVDDGLDHNLDTGSLTHDDDPTKLPLLQGTYAEHCLLAFEDLQNAGWCDWDMNDLVLDISTYYVLDAQNNVESMISVYQPLARGAGMDSQLNLTLAYAGGAEWQTIYLDENGEVDLTDNGFETDGLTVQLWSSSEDALPPFTDLKYQWGAARTERFDPSSAGKIAVATVYFDSPDQNPLSNFPLSPHDTWIYVPATAQEIHQVEYNVASSQLVYEGPLFGRSLPFARRFDHAFAWPAEGQAIWDSHPKYVDFIKSGETTHLDWAETYDLWRVWFDEDGYMPGVDAYNPVAESEIYQNYVETYSIGH
jgi:LruC domain-containing protein/uncharacterized repeat protein (TIGR01451 family)